MRQRPSSQEVWNLLGAEPKLSGSVSIQHQSWDLAGSRSVDLDPDPGSDPDPNPDSDPDPDPGSDPDPGPDPDPDHKRDCFENPGSPLSSSVFSCVQQLQASNYM